MYDQAVILLYAELESEKAPKRAIAMQANDRSHNRKDVPQEEERGNGDSICIAVKSED